MVADTLVISQRFCGPPQSGNGGYVCGQLAKNLSGAAAVRLKAPPPLEVALRIEGAVLSGEKCVVVGWLLGMEGRKRLAGSAIYSEQGHPVAVARATWIEVSRSAFTSD
jgi:hypothetical protein